jgi:hypothetical protein
MIAPQVVDADQKQTSLYTRGGGDRRGAESE